MAADPRYGSMRGRNEHIDELYAIVARTLQSRTTAEWIEALQSVDIPAGPMNSLDSLMDDPHLAAVGFFEATEYPTEGLINSLRLPVTWSKSEPRPSRPAPNLGQHDREILGESGFGSEEIESLLGGGVVGPASATSQRA